MKKQNKKDLFDIIIYGVLAVLGVFLAFSHSADNDLLICLSGISMGVAGTNAVMHILDLF